MASCEDLDTKIFGTTFEFMSPIDFLMRFFAGVDSSGDVPFTD